MLKEYSKSVLFFSQKKKNKKAQSHESLAQSLKAVMSCSQASWLLAVCNKQENPILQIAYSSLLRIHVGKDRILL